MPAITKFEPNVIHNTNKMAKFYNLQFNQLSLCFLQGNF
jgi:hypothetical protein